MSAPKDLKITVEPMASGNVLYLPLAAKTPDDKPLIKIVLCLNMTNNGRKALEVEGIDFSFPGTDIVKVMRGVASCRPEHKGA